MREMLESARGSHLASWEEEREERKVEEGARVVLLQRAVKGFDGGEVVERRCAGAG